MWCMCVASCVPFLVVFHGVHWWQVCRIQGLQDLPDAGSGPLVVCSLLFVRFLALLVVHYI